MNLFGISSVDGLIALLLIETAWWSTEFLSIVLPEAVTYLYYYFPDSLGFYFILTLVLFLVKFLLQGILWYVFLSNKSRDDSGLVRLWYWSSILLDIVLVSWSVGLEILDLTAVLTLILPFILLRTAVWAYGTLLLADIHEKSLFPHGFPHHVYNEPQVAGQVILTWEAVWYGVSFLAALLAQLVSEWTVLIPAPDVKSIAPLLVYLFTVLIAILGLVGIDRDWRVFLKVWLVFYAGLNLIGYAVLSGFGLTREYGERSLGQPVLFYALFALNVLLPICALALKLSVLVIYLKIWIWPRREEQEEEDEEDAEEDNERTPIVQAQHN